MSTQESRLRDGFNPHQLLSSFTPQYVSVSGKERGNLVFTPADNNKPIDVGVRGAAYCDDSREILRELNGEIDLIVTSPPFGLLREKEYGNQSAEDYVEWFLEFASLAYDALDDEGDFVIDIGGSWTKGQPTRSTYHFELLVELTSEGGLMSEKYGRRYNLAQDFYWYNPAKLPTPAQWVTIERIRLKDAVNHVWWLSKDNARDRAGNRPDNREVLKNYSIAQKKLMQSGYVDGLRPSGHVISDKFDQPKEDGAIRPNYWNVLDNATMPYGLDELLDMAGVSQKLRRAARENDSILELAELCFEQISAGDKVSEVRGTPKTCDNILEIANTRSKTQYLKGCDIRDATPHPARFPMELPKFFIEFLTEPGELIMDIFSGSNVTGWMAQQMDRNWIAVDREEDYVESSIFWFMTDEELKSQNS